MFWYVFLINQTCLNPHSVFKLHNVPINVKAYIYRIFSICFNLNAFPQKTETAIQGTLTGVFSPEDEVQVHSNLLKIFQALVLEAFHQ